MKAPWACDYSPSQTWTKSGGNWKETANKGKKNQVKLTKGEISKFLYERRLFLIASNSN